MTLPELRSYQGPAVAWLARRKRALMKAPAGAGKTILAAAAIHRVVTARHRPEPVRIGWICPTVEMRDQGVAALKLFPMHAVAKVECVQGEPDMSDRDVLIVDEAAHAASPLWSGVISSCKGAVWGFSATPWDTDEQRDAIMAIFKEVYEIPRSAMGGNLAHGRVRLLDDTDPGLREPITQEIRKRLDDLAGRCFGLNKNRLLEAHWEEFLAIWKLNVEHVGQLGPTHSKALAAFLKKKLGDEFYPKIAPQVCKEIGIRDNNFRNACIVRRARQHAEDYVLILVNSKEHGQKLADQIPGAVVMHSKMGAKKRKQAIDDFRAGKLHCVIATSLFDEGADVPRANVLIMACGGKAAGRVEQRTGRVLRSFEGKSEGLIYDFTDDICSLMRNQARKRLETYQKLGYTIDDGTPKLL